MVLLEPDTFLTELTRLFDKNDKAGSVFVTMKKCVGDAEGKRKGKKGDMEAGENYCLLRATDGKKKKISTRISSKDYVKFHQQYSNLLKFKMDALKKKDRKQTNVKGKAAAALKSPTKGAGKTIE